jgi:hypothetical protein
MKNNDPDDSWYALDNSKEGLQNNNLLEASLQLKPENIKDDNWEDIKNQSFI